MTASTLYVWGAYFQGFGTSDAMHSLKSGGCEAKFNLSTLNSEGDTLEGKTGHL